MNMSGQRYWKTTPRRIEKFRQSLGESWPRWEAYVATLGIDAEEHEVLMDDEGIVRLITYKSDEYPNLNSVKIEEYSARPFTEGVWSQVSKPKLANLLWRAVPAMALAEITADVDAELAAHHARQERDAARKAARRDTHGEKYEQALAGQIAQANVKYGEGVWDLVAETGCKSPATSGNRMECVAEFLKAQNVRPDQCGVLRVNNPHLWLHRKCRENEGPAAQIGATHTHSNDHSGWVIQVREAA